MDIHLDLVGGIAGDMFIAAVLDAFPEHVESTLRAIAAVSGAQPVACKLEPVVSDAMAGQRFIVQPPFIRRVDISRPVPKRRTGLSGGEHVHRSWSDIRKSITAAQLADPTKAHALAIFTLLADAEASVHGIPVDQVTFHEVGAWDSIADIVGAAHLIASIDAANWQTSPAPLGSGRVRSAHGLIPVPAPATVQLLMGMPTIDDGIAGERVTPTGAAILRYLCPPLTKSEVVSPKVRTLVRTGTGFGSKKLPGISNHVRVLCFEESSVERGGQRDIHVLEFEVDDQSGEDLAMGLERLRLHPGTLDVTQSPVFGKKGRMMTHVRVLARSREYEAVIEACFRETTTIGLRHRVVEGIGLTRTIEHVDIDGRSLRVKIAERPGGRTAKAEADDVLVHEDHQVRALLRTKAEQSALALMDTPHER